MSVAKIMMSCTAKLPLIAIIGSTLYLTGCGDYLSRRETITSYAGDAVAANKVIHTIDPWPRSAQNTRIPANAERMQRVHERYRTRADAEEDSTASSATTE